MAVNHDTMDKDLLAVRRRTLSSLILLSLYMPESQSKRIPGRLRGSRDGHGEQGFQRMHREKPPLMNYHSLSSIILVENN